MLGHCVPPLQPNPTPPPSDNDTDEKIERSDEDEEEPLLTDSKQAAVLASYETTSQERNTAAVLDETRMVILNRVMEISSDMATTEDSSRARLLMTAKRHRVVKINAQWEAEAASCEAQRVAFV
jgi:hypothetical protein